MKRGLASVLIALGAYGCAEPLAPASTPVQRFDLNGAGKVPYYNSGIDRDAAATPCRHDPHRQFDFWVGAWDMNGQRSLIRSILDGCVIEENYMPPIPPAPGVPAGPNRSQGRSISAYDRDTGRWHQTYLAPHPRSAIRMSGTFANGIMRMGAQLPGLSFHYQWYVLDEARVIQEWSFNGSPGSLPYTRIADTPLEPSIESNICSAGTPLTGGDIIRLGDFLLGEWDVSNEAGVSLGVATFTTDMAGCLIRESYVTSRGYSAHSFIYHDLNTRRWHRTFVDSEAERAELSGFMVNGALVLSGGEEVPRPGIALVRNTFRRIDGNTMKQIFETSLDGLAWTPDLTLTFRRR